MQEKIERRSNRERTEQTRGQLIAAARHLFTAKGYADTATPEIVEAAGVTRGALYHHFEDKKALFRAVCEQEAQLVAEAIEQAAPENLSLRDALIQGGDAFLRVMAAPGRTRLLLLDGPAVLGRAEMDEIDARHSGRTLRAGIAYGIREKAISPNLSIDAIAALLSAAFDRAALAIEAGGSAADYAQALAALIEGLLLPASRRGAAAS
ncbi:MULTISPECIES: TetR/AcrR family transcriptional regulator [Mesorhizobium]|uniref:TetR family transcriptional regulator n=1 Tax=Mesorhizobium denitrificans TaxID=2294114 RepID=A0A371XEE8_9HYPH|nr:MULTISPECIES: TetR family transcriptional regulator [Mesorhizobium]RFC67563.1 TetR family transcriptional regulator [Mesorhizobium denitrificans]